MGLRASAQQYRSFHSDCPHVLARTTTYVSEFLLEHQQIPSVRPSPSPGPTRRELNASNFLCFCSQSQYTLQIYSAFSCTNPKLFLLFYFTRCAVQLTSLSFLVKDKFLEVTLSCTLSPHTASQHISNIRGTPVSSRPHQPSTGTLKGGCSCFTREEAESPRRLGELLEPQSQLSLTTRTDTQSSHLKVQLLSLPLRSEDISTGASWYMKVLSSYSRHRFPGQENKV